MFLPRAPILTPGYFCSFSNGSGGQSGTRWSSHRPKRFGSGPVGFVEAGSLTRPRYSQRLSRLNFRPGCDEMVFRKSSAPTLVTVSLSHRRSLPPVQTIQVFRPLIFVGRQRRRRRPCRGSSLRRRP